MSRRIAFWRFLNTPFALWLFSSVLLSGLPFVYGNYQTRHQEQRERARRIHMLDVEIVARLQRVAVALVDAPTTPATFEQALSDIARPASAECPVHVFAEFRDTTLSGLIWELHGLVDSADSSAIRRAAMAAGRLDFSYDLVKSLGKQDSTRFYGGGDESWMQHFIEPLNLPRWGSPFTDVFKVMDDLYGKTKK